VREHDGPIRIAEGGCRRQRRRHPCDGERDHFTVEIWLGHLELNLLYRHHYDYNRFASVYIVYFVSAQGQRWLAKNCGGYFTHLNGEQVIVQSPSSVRRSKQLFTLCVCDCVCVCVYVCVCVCACVCTRWSNENYRQRCRVPAPSSAARVCGCASIPKGAKLGGLWDGSSRVGSRWQSRRRESGGRSPSEAEAKYFTTVQI